MSSSSLEIARAFGGLCAALGLGTRVENPVTKERQLPKAALASPALPWGLDGAGLVEAPGLTGRVSSEKSRQEVDSSARETGAPTQVPSRRSREADLGSKQAWSERGLAQERVKGQKTVCHHQTQVQCSVETHHPPPQISADPRWTPERGGSRRWHFMALCLALLSREFASRSRV